MQIIAYRSDVEEAPQVVLWIFFGRHYKRIKTLDAQVYFNKATFEWRPTNSERTALVRWIMDTWPHEQDLTNRFVENLFAVYFFFFFAGLHITPSSMIYAIISPHVKFKWNNKFRPQLRPCLWNNDSGSWMMSNFDKD